MDYAISKGVMGTTYIVSDWIDTKDYLTEAQILAYDAAGWDVANHTKEHLRFTDQLVTQANIEAAIVACRDYLEGIGLTRASRHLAYPWGAYIGGDSGATTFAAMAATGMLTGRTTAPGDFDVGNYIPSDPYQIPGNVVRADKTLETAKSYIDDAIANGTVVCLYLHNFTNDTPTATEWTYSDWEALIDYIVATRIPALTITQLYALGFGSIEYTPTG
jgi:peptidoglycan/xylan/chitin deacetylase (PgdA/CDA1 family)